MLTIKEIYNKFDEIGSVTFSTIDNGYPETRIAHFFAYDEEGLYLRTMYTKPFYHQLKTNKKLSVCGLNANTEVNHDSEGMPTFEPGYSIRVTGDVEEVPLDVMKKKSLLNNDFLMGYNDYLKYPAIRFFVLKRGRGEIFDYDFDHKYRNHKLLRMPFTFNEFTYPKRGMTITDKCINCGLCFKACSFKAITKGESKHQIDTSKCDVCGDCYIACPYDAITYSLN